MLCKVNKDGQEKAQGLAPNSFAVEQQGWLVQLALCTSLGNEFCPCGADAVFSGPCALGGCGGC